VVFAQWDQANVALGVAMFGVMFSGGMWAWDRYSVSSRKQRRAEIDLFTADIRRDCHERLAEKDIRIDRLEVRVTEQGKRITDLERENERLVVLSQNSKGEIPRSSPPSSGKP
jgi:zona occludens toxin (predicted ATPase)